MIQPHDTAIEINADEAGVFVSVRHKITGSPLQTRPTATELVGTVRDRLIAQIKAEIFAPDEFEFAVGHTREGGVAAGAARDYLGVTHKPSGISRAKSQRDGASHHDLLDKVLTEIWHREHGDANL